MKKVFLIFLLFCVPIYPMSIQQITDRMKDPQFLAGVKSCAYALGALATTGFTLFELYRTVSIGMFVDMTKVPRSRWGVTYKNELFNGYFLKVTPRPFFEHGLSTVSTAGLTYFLAKNAIDYGTIAYNAPVSN